MRATNTRLRPWGVALALAAGTAAHSQTLPTPPVSPVPVTNYEYDAEGNPTKTLVAPATRALATKHAYDPLSRRTSTTDAKNGVTQFGYDLQDQLTSVKDPRLLTTQYQPTGLGDVKQLVSPDTGTTNRTFDAAGNLLTRTDARNILSTYSYDALNRLTQIVYSATGSPSTSQSWTYDQTGAAFGAGIGRLTTASALNVSTTFRYDTLGRVTQTVMTTTQATPLTVTTGYDAAGHVNSITYPSGRVVKLTWANGQPQALSVAANATATAQPLLDQITSTAFGGLQGWVWQLGSTPRPHTRVYDTSGRLVRQSLGPLVRDISYDDADRISRYTHYTAATGQAAPSFDQSFSYDELDRLQTVTAANTSWSYAYDANGNRTASAVGSATRAYTVAANSNRLNALNNPDRALTYATTGVTMSDTQAGSSGNYTATYGLQGYLATLTQGTTAGTEYTYDAFGRRIKRGIWTGSSSNPRTRTVYAYDEAHHLLGEYQDNGTAITEYVWLGDTPVAVIKPNGTGIQLYAVHTDHLDTPRMLLDASGQVRWRWMGEPFGNMPAEEQPTAGLAAVQQSLRFPGQEYEPLSGKHHNYFRDYDPTTGRYVQSDPIGLAGGINTYAYVGGNPLNYADPNGLQSQTRCVGTLGFRVCQSVPGPVIDPRTDLPPQTGPTPSFINPFDGMFSTPRPKDMTRLEERQFDRVCVGAGDPCRELKAEANKAIDAAMPKVEDMLVDKGTMFGTQRWINHRKNLEGRIDQVAAIISLGQKMGCDMSAEIMRATQLWIPNAPRNMVPPR